MIVKTMSRKDPSFSQLYDYIGKGQHKEEEKYNYYHNFFRNDRESILRDFEENSALLRKRKNGNYLYHEVISITRTKELTEEEHIEKLFDLVDRYVKDRANNCFVFGGLHADKMDNLHYHLMISSNEIGKTQNFRLTKKEYDSKKLNLESLTNELYPELEQGWVMHKKKPKEDKLSNKGEELKRRTGKTPKRDKVKETLSDIFSSCKTKQDFFTQLSEAHFELYTRGKNIGVKDKDGKSYRLSTLGLTEEFNSMSKVLELEQKQHSKQQKAEDELKSKHSKTRKSGKYM